MRAVGNTVEPCVGIITPRNHAASYEREAGEWTSWRRGAFRASLSSPVGDRMTMYVETKRLQRVWVGGSRSQGTTITDGSGVRRTVG